jgi:plastocyanin
MYTRTVPIPVLLGCFGLALAAWPAQAASVDVKVDNYSFSPATVTINPGDTVRWLWEGGSHTVTSGAGCSPDGRWSFPADGSPTAGEFTFNDVGTYPYYCRPHCHSGMAGQVVVAAAPTQASKLTDPIPAPIRRGKLAVKLRPVAKGLTAPNWGTTAPGDDNRLFVTDQVGTIWVINLSTQQKSVFANLKSLLVRLGVQGSAYDERGLLGLAFHPAYQSNGLLYTYTSEPVNGAPDFSTLTGAKAADHQAVIREWHVPTPGAITSVVDPASSRVVLRIDKPQFNHNGGTLLFGPDNLLYLSLGDGGNADDQGSGHVAGGNGQSLTNVLGKILRIDPNGRSSANGQYSIPSSNPFTPAGNAGNGGQSGCTDGQCDEIFAYGLRNPFRFSFDRDLGTLYAGDVGQNFVEEVDIISSGGNYGWRKLEGRFCFNPDGANDGYVTASSDCSSAGLIGPIAQYDHDEGKAIIGGFVYRGSLLPQLRGRYIFGDYARTFNADGRLFYLQRKDLAADSTAASGFLELKYRGRSQLGIAVLGFGQDAAGEVYVLGNRTGVPRRKTGVVFKLSN